MPRVYLGLGSNVKHERLPYLRAAHRGLVAERDIQVVATSPLYESEPWESEPGAGLDERAWYLNCVVSVETTLSPRALLARLQALEAAHGRVRPAGTPEAQRFTERTLDIDILLYGEDVTSVPDELHIPHLLLHERGFVLRPLADLAPDLTHPTLYRTVRDLLGDLGDDHEVRPSGHPEPWWER